MNLIKRYLGLAWMALGPLALFYLVRTALAEIESKPVIDTKIQWAVFLVVFIPICIGLCIFGYFAWKGEYDHLPENSGEIE
jgi:hypothetical protein